MRTWAHGVSKKTNEEKTTCDETRKKIPICSKEISLELYRSIFFIFIFTHFIHFLIELFMLMNVFFLLLLLKSLVMQKVHFKSLLTKLIFGPKELFPTRSIQTLDIVKLKNIFFFPYNLIKINKNKQKKKLLRNWTPFKLASTISKKWQKWAARKLFDLLNSPTPIDFPTPI